jgi:hypothetical protein
MKGVRVAVSVMLGIAQSAWYWLMMWFEMRVSFKLEVELNTYCAECKRQVENAHVCEKSHVLAESRRYSTLDHRAGAKQLHMKMLAIRAFEPRKFRNLRPLVAQLLFLFASQT